MIRAAFLFTVLSIAACATTPPPPPAGPPPGEDKAMRELDRETQNTAPAPAPGEPTPGQ